MEGETSTTFPEPDNDEDISESEIDSDSEYEPSSKVSDTEFSDCSDRSEIFPMLTSASKPVHEREKNENLTDSDTIQNKTVSSSSDKHIVVMPTNNSNGRKYDKKSVCLYCDTWQAKLCRHLCSQHKDETEIVKYELEEDKTVKKCIMTKLRNLGNHRHNSEVLRKGEGKLIVKYRPNCGDLMAESYVPCDHCLGYFISYDLWKHVRRCPLAPYDKPKHRRVLDRCRMLLPAPTGTSAGLSTVLSTLKSDAIGRAVKGDQLILQLGERLFLRHGHDLEQYTYIRSTLRELSRLLLELRNSIGPDDASLRHFIDPAMYQKVIECAKTVAGFEISTHQFNIPSLALKLGHALKKCAKLMESSALQSGDEEILTRSTQFFKLCDMNWTEDISTHALRSLSEQQRNKVKFIPLIKDVTLLTNHLKTTAEEAFKKLCSKGDDTEAWQELNEAALTQVMQFNRRRQGEISKVKITDYNSQHTTLQDDLSQSLSPLEQKLCHSLRRMEIIGKRGRTVPVILTKDMTRWIDLLLATRDIIGVNSDNKFLFPRCHYGSIGHIRGCDTLRNASEACGAKFPQLLRSTKLRKQIGTLSQLLNLKDNELDILATFMGHDIRVHREYYRLPDETLQVAKISKVLLSLENGQFSENQGRSLDDITVDVDEGNVV